MGLSFYKYQGTGNDFIMLDGRISKLDFLTQAQIEKLCDRRFGIGADGLIILNELPGYDFEMVYFNSDGRQSSMCGNGGRCIVRFAHDLGIHKSEYLFKAIDGDHRARIKGDTVSLEMIPVGQLQQRDDSSFFLDTGSPHHVAFKASMPGAEFVDQARSIRNSESYRREGVNVNFVKALDDGLEMRTFERGVEDETYSCGTGVTAAALAAHYSRRVGDSPVAVKTAGGNLSVSFEAADHGYQNIWLSGPAGRVFEGMIEL